jgi:hypothetical protein
MPINRYGGSSAVTTTSTIQTAYNNSNSPELILDPSRGALTLRDAASPITGNLFEVQNNSGATTYFAVTRNGVNITGTTVISGDTVITGTTTIQGTTILQGPVNVSSGTTINVTNISGTAGTADKLTNARTIALSGPVTGSGQFDGSGNLTIPTTITPGSIGDNELGTISIAKVTNLQTVLNTFATTSNPIFPTGIAINGDLNMNGYKVINAATPTVATDLATKAYVDSIAMGLYDPKDSVRVAVNSNINIASAPAAADGITLGPNNRILLFGQTNPAENGIYVFTTAGAALTRSIDADTSAELNTGAFVYVEEGTQAGSQYVLITQGSITLGTTPLSFAKFNNTSVTGSVEPGTGLGKAGNTIFLANVATVTPGSYGTAVAVPTVAVDAQGRVSTIVNTPINFPVASVNGKTGSVVLVPSDIAGLYNNVTLTGTTTAATLNATTVSGDGSGLTNLTPAAIGNDTALWNARRIQGVNVLATAPTDGQTLVFNAGTNRYEPSTVTASGSRVFIGDNPPVSPTPVAGDMWWSSEQGKLKIFYNDGTSSQWVDASPQNAANTASITISDNPPPSPNNSNLWWDSTTAKLMIYYVDQDSSQWVDATPQALVNSTSAGSGMVGLAAGSPTVPSLYFLNDPATGIYQPSAGSLAVSGTLLVGGGTRATANGVIHSISTAKAWIVYSVTNGTILSSYNISSASRQSAGNYTINFSVPMVNNQYVVVGNAGSITSAGTTGVNVFDVTLLNLNTNFAQLTVAYGNGAPYDPQTLTAVVFGA